MTREPIDATERILRQIQETLAHHGQTLADHTRRFDGVERLLQEIGGRVGEIRSGMVTTLGLAANADVRQEEMQRELQELRRRIEALEEKV